MAQVEIDTPSTGSDVEVSFSVAGWVSPTTGSNRSLFSHNLAGSNCQPGIRTAHTRVRGRLGYRTSNSGPGSCSIHQHNGERIGLGNILSSDTTDDITASNVGDPPPIMLNPFTVAKKSKSQQVSASSPVGGTDDTSTKAVSICVQVLTFKVWKKASTSLPPKPKSIP